MSFSEHFTYTTYELNKKLLRQRLLSTASRYGLRINVHLLPLPLDELCTLACELADAIQRLNHDLVQLDRAVQLLDQLDADHERLNARNMPDDWMPDPTEGYDVYGYDCTDFSLVSEDLNDLPGLDLRDKKDAQSQAYYSGALIKLSKSRMINKLLSKPILYHQPYYQHVTYADIREACTRGLIEKESAVAVALVRHGAIRCRQAKPIDYATLNRVANLEKLDQFRIAGLTSVVSFGPYKTLCGYLEQCVLPRLDFYYTYDDPDQFPYSFCYLHLVHVRDRYGLITGKNASVDSKLHLFNAEVARRLPFCRPAISLLRLYIEENGSMHISNTCVEHTERPYVPIWPADFNAALLSWFDTYGPQPTKSHGLLLFRIAQDLATARNLYAYDLYFSKRRTNGACRTRHGPDYVLHELPELTKLEASKPLFLTD